MAETLDVLKKLGKSVARGVPQLATGFVDLAALPLTMTGLRQPEQIFGSTAYLTDKGLLPQPQTGLLNEGAELASSMVNPAAAAKGATVGLLGTFIGKGSKLWNAESNSVAKALEKEGLAPETIWSQTGNVKAPDGKWRQEISDVGSKITDNVYEGIKANKRFEGTMSTALEHPELYKAYPDLANIKTSMYASPISSGSYDDYTNTILVGGPGTTSQKSTALHELQHGIQSQEKFGRGGNVEEFLKNIKEQKLYSDANILSRLNADANDINTAKYRFKQQFKREPTMGAESIALSGLTPDEILTKKNSILSPEDSYRRLLGEAEARLTQSRMQLTPEQRLQYYPYTESQYGLDVPYNELVVKRGLLK